MQVYRRRVVDECHVTFNVCDVMEIGASMRPGANNLA